MNVAIRSEGKDGFKMDGWRSYQHKTMQRNIGGNSHERNKTGGKMERLSKGYLKFYLNSMEAIHPSSNSLCPHAYDHVLVL